MHHMLVVGVIIPHVLIYLIALLDAFAHILLVLCNGAFLFVYVLGPATKDGASSVLKENSPADPFASRSFEVIIVNEDSGMMSGNQPFNGGRKRHTDRIAAVARIILFIFV